MVNKLMYWGFNAARTLHNIPFDSRMPGPVPPPLVLSTPQEHTLERITQRHTAPQNLVRRAHIILAAADGLNNSQIARRFGAGLNTVKRWRHRWVEAQPQFEAVAEDAKQLELRIIDTLSDEHRSGTPPTFSAEVVAEIIALACQKPEDVGRPVTHWTHRDLADEVVKQGIVDSISPRQAGRFLKRSRHATASESLLAQSRD